MDLSIQEQLLIEMKRQGLSMSDIAKITGKTRGAISATFKEKNPKVETLNQIARCLGYVIKLSLVKNE